MVNEINYSNPLILKTNIERCKSIMGMTLLSDISKIINLIAISSLASSFAKSLAAIQSCKRNINVIIQRLSSFSLASSFAKPFAENHNCKENNTTLGSLAWS